MDRVKVKVYMKDKNSKLPRYKTVGSSGADLYSTMNITLQPMERAIISTGLYVELPFGIEMQIRPRSGLAIKYGITLINCVGTLDCDYRGELGVPLVNLSNEPYTINIGDRIAQMVLNSYAVVEEWEVVEELEDLGETERGAGGFGSTGE